MSRGYGGPAGVGLVVAATLVGAALRVWVAHGQSYWYDESVSVFLIRQSFGDMLHSLASTENTPPLYYLLAWPWTRIVGDAELSLRALSIIFGTATIPLSFLTGRALVSARAGIVAALLVAVSPSLVL